MHHIRAFAIIALILSGITLPLHAAQADTSPTDKQYAIAAIVNDDVITFDDVQERLMLVSRLSGLPESAEIRQRLLPQIIQILIDETLQIQAAERRGIRPTDAEIDAALDQIAAANKYPSGEAMTQTLRAEGLNMDSLRQQMKAQLSWTKYMSRHIQPRVKINAYEISEAVEALSAGSGVTEIKIEEIFLPVDDPSQEADTEKLVEKLSEQLQEEADFTKLSGQFPGNLAGDDGWLALDQLPDTLRREVSQLAVGEITPPVRSPSGYHLIRLLDQSNALGAKADEATVTLRQIIVPLAKDANATAAKAAQDRVTTLTETLKGCREFEEEAKARNQPAEWDLGAVPMSKLHPALKEPIKSLAIGQMAPVFRTPLGLHIVMLCGRTYPQATLLNRTMIRESLFRRKMMLEAQRALRDLRRAALIDVKL